MIDLITGHQGMAHITAEQISDINNAMMDGYGVDKVMRLDGGDVTLDGLSLIIEVGYWRVNGFDMEIKEEETLYFDPTVAGVSRIDDVYVEILQDITDGYQRAVLVIVQGEPDVSPVAPDEPTIPELNTDILLQIVHVARCTISSGAMTVSDKTIVYKYVSPEDLTSITIKGSTNNTGSTITSGTYFYLNGDLVKAKTSIANGATLTLNTNYEIPTAGALNALNSALTNKIDTSAIANNLTTTGSGKVLDARQGKILNTAVTQRLQKIVGNDGTTSLNVKIQTSYVSETTSSAGFISTGVLITDFISVVPVIADSSANDVYLDWRPGGASNNYVVLRARKADGSLWISKTITYRIWHIISE